MMENIAGNCSRGNMSDSVVQQLATEEPLFIAATKMSLIWQSIIIVGGILGNILIVLAMRHSSNRWNSCANYIAVLAVSDSVALIRKSVDHINAYSETRYTVFSCSIWVYIALSACQYSMLLVMCMTVDRMIFVRFPNRSAIYCNVKRARIVMAILLLAALTFNIPHLFFTVPISNGQYCAAFGENQIWSFVYGWIQVVINFIIPFIALSVMTVIIIHTLRKNSRVRQELCDKRAASGNQQNMNFVIHIEHDGLFNFVLAYIVDGLKSLQRQISNSSINVSNCSRTVSTLPRDTGNINEAYSRSNDTLYNRNSAISGYSVETDHKRPTPSVTRRDQNEENNQDNDALSYDSTSMSNSDIGDIENGVDCVDGALSSRHSTSEPSFVGQFEQPHPPEYIDEESEHSARYSRQSSRDKTTNQLCVLLILVVVFFVVLTAPQHIRYIVYNHNFLNRWQCPKAYAIYVMIYHVSSKAYFTNCAVNFYLYFCGSSMFRRTLKDIFVSMFTCCCRRNNGSNAASDGDVEIRSVSQQCDQTGDIYSIPVQNECTEIPQAVISNPGADGSVCVNTDVEITRL